MESSANFASRDTSRPAKHAMEPSAQETGGGASGPRNQVVCPRCGRVRLETPPGTSILPTLGMARKAAGVTGDCGCGKAPHERPGAEHGPGDTSAPGTGGTPDVRDE